MTAKKAAGWTLDRIGHPDRAGRVTVPHPKKELGKGPERFQAKRIPVRVKKTRKNKKLKHIRFADLRFMFP
jgi:hypothetical protein